GLIFYTFRIMVGIGFFFAALMLFTALQWLRGKLTAEKIVQQRLLLYGWLFAAPLGYLAVECGWIVRCVGRQPWVVYGQIRTADVVSPVPAGDILASLTSFVVVYSILLFATLFFGSRILQQGPNLNLPLPGIDTTGVDVSPAEHIPDSRPAEATQEAQE
ncbi:MAG: cytochrome ubiquinol oxidase subunit I, partial [Anaerolineae bacterium]|nr:cytochrome ubiquinol oxidase subunit I [Gloeobacterales cyanobacterium ES-bin-313]